MMWIDQLRDGSLARRWTALSTRERRLVAVAAVVLATAIVYSGVVAPVQAFHEQALAKFQQQEAQLEWMRRHRGEARREHAAQPAVRNQSLLTLVDGTAREFDLRLASYRSESGGGVSVVVQRQAFDGILRWIQALSERHGIRVIQASIDGQGEGRVNARFVIR